jgi:hypothetical protein
MLWYTEYLFVSTQSQQRLREEWRVKSEGGNRSGYLWYTPRFLSWANHWFNGLWNAGKIADISARYLLSATVCTLYSVFLWLLVGRGSQIDVVYSYLGWPIIAPKCGGGGGGVSANIGNLTPNLTYVGWIHHAFHKGLILYNAMAGLYMSFIHLNT